jgi:hypothetical protein
MTNPYQHLPARNFWRTAVSGTRPGEYADIWQPKFAITPASRIATAGSCFAQHISQRLKAAGYAWVDSEPAPRRITADEAAAYGYGVFSFRTANIYTSSLLRQWVEAAVGKTPLPDEVWARDGRYRDPFRPTIEPNGYGSHAECLHARAYTLNCIREALAKIDVLVFTLGLTEAWRNKETGFTYPACPGTLAGAFDPARHEFHNLSFNAILDDLGIAFSHFRAINPGVRFLLTVSPVPLTATASADHVLAASTYSKSVLRAVAGALAHGAADVDYFPSYEIIASHPSRGAFFDANLRTVASHGVDTVMRTFFEAIGASPARRVEAVPVAQGKDIEDGDTICEDALLEAFAPGADQR